MYKIPPKASRKDAPAHQLASASSNLPFSEQLFLIWWLVHIPITLFVDLQGILASYYPTAIRNLGLWWEEVSGDPYMYAGARGEMSWFRSFLFAEATFQLPCFFLFIYGIYNSGFLEFGGIGFGMFYLTNRPSAPTTERAWIDALSLIYAGHVCTTVYTIYFDLFTTKGTWDSLSTVQQMILLGAYTPYFVVPSLWAVRCWRRLVGGKVEGTKME